MVRITNVTGRVNVAAAVLLALSVTVTEKVEVTAVEGGVPPNTPLVKLSHNGKLEPVETDHVYPPAPPSAANGWLYGVPMVAAGRGEDVATNKLTGRVTWPEMELPLLSVTVTVKVEVTAEASGVPVMSPAEVGPESPAGGLPPVNAQV